MSGGGKLRYRVSADDEGVTLETVLRERLGLSRRALQRLTRNRGMIVNGRKGWLARKMKRGDRVVVKLGASVRPVARPVAALSPGPPIRILMDDPLFAVADKPAGLLCHLNRGRSGDCLETRLRAAWAAGDARPHLVHRLDRDVSGALLVAKSGYAHALLDRQLRAGEIERVYEGWVRGTVDADAGSLDFPIGRDPGLPHRRRVDGTGDPARTHFRVLARSSPDPPNLTRLELRLETGRTHQIRVHLAHAGYPLLGDRLYGDEDDPAAAPGPGRLALHARRLRFRRPRSGEEIVAEAEVPPVLERILASAGERLPEGREIGLDGDG